MKHYSITGTSIEYRNKSPRNIEIIPV